MNIECLVFALGPSDLQKLKVRKKPNTQKAISPISEKGRSWLEVT